MSTVQDHEFQRLPYEDAGQSFDISYILGIIKRRAFYFVIPFLLAVMGGLAVIEMQRPVYRAQGEILVESPAIPADLVSPTITELPDQRFEVIKQRIMAESNLMALVEKYDLFPKARKSLPRFKLFDVVRTRVLLEPVQLSMSRPGSTTTAFTVSFDYEVPSIALSVTNELINQILSQDSSRRANAATQAAKYLEQDVDRLQQQHNALVAQIEALKQRPPDQGEALSAQSKEQLKVLAALEAELVQKSTIYSNEYPAIKELKRKIAALQKSVARDPRATAIIEQDDKPDVAIRSLEQQDSNLQKNLGEANRKLAAARLGETMERNQQAEHLQLIASPDLPHEPVRPQKIKWFAVALALAVMMGAGCVLAGEVLDRTIHRTSELARLVDPHLIVNVPYIVTPGEHYRKRRNLVLVCVLLVAVLGLGIGAAVVKGPSVDFGRSWTGIVQSFGL